MYAKIRAVTFIAGVALYCGIATPLWAVDGVILIDQNKALAGNVTPGDAPGFPVTISLSGSYRLSGNLTVPNENTTAIDVTGAASAVSIDLNGFAILGPTVCDTSIPPVCSPVAADPSIFGPGVGIRSSVDGSLTIRNGAIRGMGRNGVFVSGSPLVSLDQLQVRDNGLGGLFIGIGNVTNSIVSRNGGHGIILNQGVVKGNHITRNGGSGVTASGLQINVLENTILQNSAFGIDFGATGAYGSNVLSSNVSGAVSGSAFQVSGNVCNGALCP